MVCHAIDSLVSGVWEKGTNQPGGTIFKLNDISWVLTVDSVQNNKSICQNDILIQRMCTLHTQ